jgi:hypothetical protein
MINGTIGGTFTLALFLGIGMSSLAADEAKLRCTLSVRVCGTKQRARGTAHLDRSHLSC